MSTQQMFNDSVLGIVKQGKPAFDPKANVCRNLTSEGTRCAVGVLIPSDRYDPVTESMELSVLYDRYLKDIYQNVDVELLRRMRKLHDNLAEEDRRDFLQQFIEGVRVIACHFNLTVPDAEISAAVANVKEW